MNDRNRSQGWQYAKLSGHSNEERVKELLDSDTLYLNRFMQRAGYANEIVVGTSIGGLHETNVDGVLGGSTKSKTDLKIYCQSGRVINISIKKSLAGQVYFVRAGLFIEVFERQFGKIIPREVCRGIELFWSAADDAVDVISEYANHADRKSYDLQIRHRSLNSATLYSYSPEIFCAMLNWFSENMYELTKLSFSMGAAAQHEEWSEFVWYINLVGEHNVDMLFSIEELCHAAMNQANDLTAFSANGTTLQLPFGFVQWHQQQMQFHHQFVKLRNLLEE